MSKLGDQKRQEEPWLSVVRAVSSCWREGSVPGEGAGRSGHRAFLKSVTLRYMGDQGA